ncbi:MAG: chorismate dehydratase [Candidatus Latescibacterota bacterium]|jgi:chorismate dehydratase
MSLRLGVVSFLNARPLAYSLQNDPRFVLSHSVPSACAADLAAGRVDVGLIPSIEYARSNVPYEMAPGLAIATGGEVLTVRLYYRESLDVVRRVALDTSSRTSVALLRILLRERYGFEPVWVEAKPDLAAMLEVADAALLIGDPVFEQLSSDVPSIDLGSEWVEHTGLPFVFAFWAGRVGALDRDALHGLELAKQGGVAHIDEIAGDYADIWGGDAGLYARYLRENIRFDLGENEVEGLRLFYSKAREHGLIEAVPTLSFCS